MGRCVDGVAFSVSGADTVVLVDEAGEYWCPSAFKISTLPTAGG